MSRLIRSEQMTLLIELRRKMVWRTWTHQLTKHFDWIFSWVWAPRESEWISSPTPTPRAFKGNSPAITEDLFLFIFGEIFSTFFDQTNTVDELLMFFPSLDDLVAWTTNSFSVTERVNHRYCVSNVSMSKLSSRSEGRRIFEAHNNIFIVEIAFSSSPESVITCIQRSKNAKRDRCRLCSMKIPSKFIGVKIAWRHSFTKDRVEVTTSIMKLLFPLDDS